jgi:S-DNA-T family DNA segregation ATPase FtsK/SpoIIIE
VKWYSKIPYQRKSEFLGFLMIVVALFVFLSLGSRTDGDARWLRADQNDIWVDTYYPRNLAGTIGALVAFTLYEFLGWWAWLAAMWVGAYGLKHFLLSKKSRLVRIVGTVSVGVFLVGVLIDLPAAKAGQAWTSGIETVCGQLGRSVAHGVTSLFGVAGGSLLIGAVLLLGIYWLIPWKSLHLPQLFQRKKRKETRKKPSVLSVWLTRLRQFAINVWQWLVLQFERLRTFRTRKAEPEADAEAAWQMVQREDALTDGPMTPQTVFRARDVEAESEPEPEAESQLELKPAPRASGPKRVSPGKLARDGDYEYPSLDLLEPPVEHDRRSVNHASAEILLNALQTFDVGVDGPIESYPGPVITRFEFRPAPGVKVSRIASLADDLALALSASRVRVVAPIPGKSAVGIEIPNADPEIVSLSKILADSEFVDSDAMLPLGLGETIDGQTFVVDLATMPHLLIAGATGSGKSVCINVIITSLLFRHNPRDVRLLFIDPKMLELSIYKGIPHLERPVVTNPRAAERLLSDAVKEMDDRYRTLADAGVRNIADYNRKADADSKLPYIVIVVDELADLMLSQSASKIEMLITRLAQMARAVGIHLILATQRPSVDVITGLIKANFSCRIAFQVATKVDSRTILDGNGAEKLLGRGDMLFLSPGRPEPERIHGAFISGAETNDLAEFLREQVVEPEAIQNFSETTEGSVSADDDFGDVLFNEAAETVIRHKQGSVSLLQRRLGIGYQRAARLIDKLEEAGVVGPYDGSKAREVLWTMADYDEKMAQAAN